MKNPGVPHVLGAVAIVALATSVDFRGCAENAADLPQAAPAWQLQSPDGKTVHSSEFKGKIVVLNFWATWCPPCQAEIPGFIELQKEYAKQGLAIVGISEDDAGSTNAVKAFVRKMGINYTVVMGNDKVAEAYNEVEGLPTTFIIDRQGRIVHEFQGYITKERLMQHLKPLLDASPASPGTEPRKKPASAPPGTL